ncbi:MAG: leucyl aminopeptidase [Dehalococcoidia bacterium]|nr:MAG: leucyl aminopeptidase [Dehalococcoidia bacterium]
MKISIVVGDITRQKTGAIIVGLFEGKKILDSPVVILDKALRSVISRLIKSGQIKGKLDEINIIHSLGELPADRVVVVGMGKKKDFTTDRIRGAFAEVCRQLKKQRVNDITIVADGVGINAITMEDSIQAMTEGTLLGLYSFRKYMSGIEDKPIDIKKMTIVADRKANIPLVENGSRRGRILAEAAILARDMVNEPANYMTPTDMAEVAVRVAREHGLELTVLDEKEMQKLGMGALLGVAQGSCQEPKFIILGYNGRNSDEIDITLVGKGITFDSGGISIKPSSRMEEMKTDMAGGAAIMAAMTAIAQLKLRINVTAMIPAVENLPGGAALKPGDVLKAITGKTIEIITTDAEGRLILADALGYANMLKAKRIIDVATLTGACQVALGSICTGVFGNDQELLDGIIAAGDIAGEPMWQMPMYDEYKEQNKSDIADIKNAAKGGAGAITAAQFLAVFAGNTPWVHLDIAGTSFADKERKYYTKGATGVPVRTLVNLIMAISDRK